MTMTPPLELEQIAELPQHRGQGVGRALIQQSMPMAEAALASQGSTLKRVMVTTRADNGPRRCTGRRLAWRWRPSSATYTRRTRW